MPALFVAAGQDGARVTSTNGSEWKNLQLGKEGETYRVVAFGNGRFVAAGSYGGGNIFATTAAGEQWEASKSDAKYVRYVRGLGFNGHRFIGIGGDPGSVGASSPFYITSADGLSWSEIAEIGGKHIIRRLAFGKGLVVGVGDRGRRVVTTDLKEWKDAPDTKAIETLVDVAFGAGRFVGVGLHGLRMSSVDGLAWSDKQTGEEGQHLNAVVWTGDQFVAVGAGATYFSQDGITWEKKPNQDAPANCCFGSGIFVGTAWKGRVRMSRDALAWQEVFQCEQHLEAVAFGET